MLDTKSYTWPGLVELTEKIGRGKCSSKHYNIHGHTAYSRGGQEFILGGPNQGPKSKVEGEARIEGASRASRAKPESKARSARELRAKPEPRAKPEKNRGEGSGEGAR